MIAPEAAARLFEAACRAELLALKPGNVHVHAAGHGMEVAQFEAAARAASGPLSAPGAPVGARIERAVTASLAVAGCNTNLGILLLCAPLLAAAEGSAERPFPARVEGVLAALTLEDAQAVFRAITAANPGGLGSAQEDVRTPARVPLRAAMAAAADYDLIARQYAHGFVDIFSLGMPLAAVHRGDPAQAAQAAFLAFLQTCPDSHIGRKFGAEVAEAVRNEARTICAGLEGRAGHDRTATLLAFDADLKARGLNPGTSADLTVASLLADALMAREG
ncbi:triphosphoribosyl-dephospho-CoA synthase [Aquabacter sp. L1I39]|uniref:triphosphoribosyl-dephospho-CoA synthase n=1 Tax=Aquabacter sp. L1I39 TaxID=2820278 RepID=UPI001ADD3FD1|nr:triphosphoribosyl-dephospho-CoA synthase [Aquabacter sp. L1I39]QTL03698.1 triphosphoribosyl-dephospho-CoA synthase [Aquabacter sp. L1I39]